MRPQKKPEEIVAVKDEGKDRPLVDAAQEIRRFQQRAIRPVGALLVLASAVGLDQIVFSFIDGGTDLLAPPSDQWVILFGVGFTLGAIMAILGPKALEYLLIEEGKPTLKQYLFLVAIVTPALFFLAWVRSQI